MSSCERCWYAAMMRGLAYETVLAEAEKENAPCTTKTIEGAKLRAGAFWDDLAQCDSRDNPHKNLT